MGRRGGGGRSFKMTLSNFKHHELIKCCYCLSVVRIPCFKSDIPVFLFAFVQNGISLHFHVLKLIL